MLGLVASKALALRLSSTKLKSVSQHLSHVSRPATGGSTGCGGMGLVLVLFASLCVLPSALACFHFLRAARNACTTNYRVRVPFFYASSGVPFVSLLPCGAVFVRLSRQLPRADSNMMGTKKRRRYREAMPSSAPPSPPPTPPSRFNFPALFVCECSACGMHCRARFALVCSVGSQPDDAGAASDGNVRSGHHSGKANYLELVSEGILSILGRVFKFDTYQACDLFRALGFE